MYNPYDTDPDLMIDWTELEYLQAYASAERYVRSKHFRNRTDCYIGLSHFSSHYWKTYGHDADSTWADCIEFTIDAVEE